MTRDFFTVFGVAPALGRVFARGGPSGRRARRRPEPSALVRAAGRGRDILGRTIRLDGELYTVVGVMPRAFDYARENEELWIPAAFTPETLADHDNHNLVRVSGS